MTIVLAITIGAIYAAAIYLILRRSIVKLVIGLAVLSHAGNLLIMTSAGLERGRIPIMGPDEKTLQGDFPDPVPQALVLTAIVIAFGVLAFSLTLFRRAYETVGTDDLDQMKSTDA